MHFLDFSMRQTNFLLNLGSSQYFIIEIKRKLNSSRFSKETKICSLFKFDHAKVSIFGVTCSKRLWLTGSQTCVKYRYIHTYKLYNMLILFKVVYFNVNCIL